MKKKTIDDLLIFCKTQGQFNFDANDNGYKVCVQIPTTFSTEDTVDDTHRGMLKVKIRMFHTGVNRNNSYVSKEAAIEAMSTIKDRPLLARIHQLDDGTWDFHEHDIEIEKDKNGNKVINYIEQQIGSFSSDEPFWEHDDENDKDFVCAYAYIAEEYSKAAEIIRKKNGTKNSCELAIEKFSYNAKENYLDLEKFYVSASTFLGKRKDGTEIREGMCGSRADIVDFSEKNNSLLSNNAELKEFMQEIHELNKNLAKYNDNTKKGETGQMELFQTLLEKYNVTIEQVTFEYDGFSDEELEAKFAEVFGKSEPTPAEPTEPTEPVIENESIKPEKFSITMNNGTVKEFALSLADIHYALNSLVNEIYGEADNTYYGCDVYESGYVVMHDYCSGRHYRQSYSREEEKFSLTGDRQEVFAEYLTVEEQTKLAEMRTNYSSISEQLQKYQMEEEKEKKNVLLASEDYMSVAKTEEFAALVKENEEKSDMTFAEVKQKADDILLTHAKKGTLSFAASTTPQSGKKMPFTTQKKNKVYGNLFEGIR